MAIKIVKGLLGAQVDVGITSVTEAEHCVGIDYCQKMDAWRRSSPSRRLLAFSGIYSPDPQTGWLSKVQTSDFRILTKIQRTHRARCPGRASIVTELPPREPPEIATPGQTMGPHIHISYPYALAICRLRLWNLTVYPARLNRQLSRC